MITSDNRHELLHEPTPAVGVRFTADRLYVALADGRDIGVPLARFPLLAGASAEQRSRWELEDGGLGIRWPDVDEDISVAHLQGVTD